MTTKIVNQSPKSKAPKEVLVEQMTLAFATYHHAERSERIKRGMAKRKAERRDGKRNTNHTN